MINQPSLSVLRLPEWFYFIILGIALSLLGELPWGGWLQIPTLSIVWWRLAALGSSSSRRSLEGGFAFGLGYFVIGLWWIYISLHDVGGMHAVLSAAAVLLLSAYMAIFFALASALAFRLRSTSIFLNSSIAAAAWVMMEYLRGQLFTGFPWLGFAESQVNGPFWPIAPLLGGLGSSFFSHLGFHANCAMATLYLARLHSGCYCPHPNAWFWSIALYRSDWQTNDGSIDSG